MRHTKVITNIKGKLLQHAYTPTLRENNGMMILVNKKKCMEKSSHISLSEC